MVDTAANYLYTQAINVVKGESEIFFTCTDGSQVAKKRGEGKEREEKIEGSAAVGDLCGGPKQPWGWHYWGSFYYFLSPKQQPQAERGVRLKLRVEEEIIRRQRVFGPEGAIIGWVKPLAGSERQVRWSKQGQGVWWIYRR